MDCQRKERLRAIFSTLALVALATLGASAVHATDGTTEAAPVYPTPLGIGLEEWSYPYPVHFLSLTDEGQSVRMAYMDVPPTGTPNGRTVVLLHGKNFGGFYWEGPVRVLTSAGFRVVVPDQIGFGKSSKPDLAYSFDLLAANTAALLDALHLPRTVIVGHSTGGMLAVRFALTYPGRVEQLVLEDPLGLEDYRRTAPYQSTETLTREQLDMTPEAYRHYVQGYFVHWSPQFEHALVEPYVRVMASGEYPRFAKSAALTYQMIYQEPVVYELGDLKMPVLIVFGAKDRTAPGKKSTTPAIARTLGDFPNLVARAAAVIPACRVVEVPDVGHIPHLEAPEAFNSALIDFLAPSR